MSGLLRAGVAALMLAGLCGCVVAPAAPPPPGYAYGYAPGYYYGPPIGIGVGGCWGCGWGRWR